DDNRFFTVDGGARFTLNGFTLQNGNGPGGAIWNQVNGTLIVNDSTFTGNSSSAFGGAIYTDRATLIINNSTFANNSAGTTGGAISLNLSG
ncbi:MAG TPA: hypothetical protein PLZ51_26780, partial [Aggregatilineales bacterium]|nr:hypothetical protein [Aggregatilineales bacterium]